VFTPHPIGRCQVVDPCKVVELIQGRLARRDPELMLEFPYRSNLDAVLVLLNLLLLEVIERVRAAGVGPHVREGDLLRGPLLEEKFAVGGAEDEDGEGTVEETFVDVLHKMT